MNILLIPAAVLFLLMICGLVMLVVATISAPAGMEDRRGFHFVHDSLPQGPAENRD
jgi:hypothetical protein